MVLLLPRRRRALHLDADAHLAGRARPGGRPRAARGRDPPPRRAARRRLAHDRVLDADPHDRRLPGPLQRPADAVADRGGRRRLVSSPCGARPRTKRPSLPRCRNGTRTNRHLAKPQQGRPRRRSGDRGARVRRVLARREPVGRAGAPVRGGGGSRSSVATGILNVWQHDPADVAARARRARCDHPGPLPARHRRSATRRRRATTRAR